MAAKRSKVKGRSESGRFFAIPYNVWAHHDFASLSPKATKLLIDVLGQYNGKNNGDMILTKAFLKTRGWNSVSQIYKARDELLEKELIVLTRQGGRNRCSLYAFTWRNIDECKGKLDINPTVASYRVFNVLAPNTRKP
tara:strand:- start:1415 stop:1828 length:414 start_codon:yes stop_codon:yes gene_type:complete